jgi:hypothetical protein
MYNAIPMQKRWIHTAASLPHPTGLTFHEKGLHFRSGSSGSSLHGTGASRRRRSYFAAIFTASALIRSKFTLNVFFMRTRHCGTLPDTPRLHLLRQPIFRTRLFYEIIPVKSIFGGDELHFWKSESVSMPHRSRAYPIIKIVGRWIIIE